MIQITAYLRTEDDHTKWKLVTNKTEFLHNALNGRIDSELPRPTINSFVRGNGNCRNGHPLDKRGRCLQKDCKYA